MLTVPDRTERPSRSIASGVNLQRCVCVSAWLVGLAMITITLRAAAPKPAVSTDPIRAILDAFRSHRVVALSEGRHGNEQGHPFRLALIATRASPPQ